MFSSKSVLFAVMTDRNGIGCTKRIATCVGPDQLSSQTILRSLTLTGASLYYYVRVVICNLNATSRNVVLKIGTKRGWDNLFAQKKCWSKFNLCISFSVAVKVQPYVPEDVSPQQQGRRRPMTRPVVQCTWSTLYISRRRKPGKGR